MKLFGREPTLWIAVLNAAVILVGTFGLKVLTGDQAALAVVVINAAFAAFNAYLVRPISPAAFTYLVGAVVALLAAYGLSIPTDTVASLNVAIIAALALLTRGQVSPQESKVSNA